MGTMGPMYVDTLDELIEWIHRDYKPITDETLRRLLQEDERAEIARERERAQRVRKRVRRSDSDG